MAENQTIKIKILPTWEELECFDKGYYRFKFGDGGIVDWWAYSTGTLSVRGQAKARSYQLLRNKAPNKSKPAHNSKVPVKDEKDFYEKLKRIRQRFKQLLPPREIELPVVPDISWSRSSQLHGSRFQFTDGTILQYYSSTKNLLIQGSPTPAVEETLRSLPSPFEMGLDKLTNCLAQLFPDTAKDGTESEMDNLQENWTPQINALDWQAIWGETQEFRQAANGNENSPCQKEFLEDWASVLNHHREKRHLIAQAPTGLGKTVSALVPALAWVAEAPNHRRVYYLVNRISQHDNPIRELKKLDEAFRQKAGRSLRVVDLVGRSRLCLEPYAKKLGSVCKQTRNNASFKDIPERIYSWQELQEELSGNNQVCPYHFLQGIMSKAQIVICDYWWFFSKTAQEDELLRLSGISSSENALIVDEAHNLPLRVRAEFDIEENFDHLFPKLETFDLEIQEVIKSVIQAIFEATLDEEVELSKLQDLAGGKDTIKALLQSLKENENFEQDSSLEERFLRLLLQPDSQAIFYRTQDQEGNHQLIGKLIDPTSILTQGYNLAYASLTMSGTLAAPTDDPEELKYQIPLFGLQPEHTLTRRYQSPFPPKNQQWIYVPDTYGTYNQRDKYVSKYVEHITAIGKVTPKVTAVFFNSYQFLQKVLDAIPNSERELTIIEKQSDINAHQLDSQSLNHYSTRLEQFIEEHQRAYLFAVYQGKIAEGASFTNNLIKTVICISLPLEYPGAFHEKLKESYQKLFEPIDRQHIQQKADEYSTRRLPLSLVLQACGRGIRTESDRCSFVLLDYRYGPGKGHYDWRSYLNPPPYNLRKPSQTVENFHSSPLPQLDEGWDSLILSACQGNTTNAN